MGGKLSIISILSYLTGANFCSRSEWQRPVKPQCFIAPVAAQIGHQRGLLESHKVMQDTEWESAE